MIGSIVPRPIGWISTVDAAGRPNPAPFSFFNAAGDKIDIAALQPIGRLAGNGYCRVAPAMFDLARPAS